MDEYKGDFVGTEESQKHRHQIEIPSSVNCSLKQSTIRYADKSSTAIGIDAMNSRLNLLIDFSKKTSAIDPHSKH
jgi:hypothetical protein